MEEGFTVDYVDLNLLSAVAEVGLKQRDDLVPVLSDHLWGEFDVEDVSALREDLRHFRY